MSGLSKLDGTTTWVMYPEVDLEFSSLVPHLVYNAYLAYILYYFVLVVVKRTVFVVYLGRFYLIF